MVVVCEPFRTVFSQQQQHQQQIALEQEIVVVYIYEKRNLYFSCTPPPTKKTLMGILFWGSRCIHLGPDLELLCVQGCLIFMNAFGQGIPVVFCLFIVY